MSLENKKNTFKTLINHKKAKTGERFLLQRFGYTAHLCKLLSVAHTFL